MPRHDPLPLSYGQERLWFLHQLAPASAVYHIPLAVRLCGRLDVAALTQSLGALVARHDVLRTSFPLVDGQPVQLVAPHLPFSLPLVNLQRLTQSEQEAEMKRFAGEAAKQPFDLANGPLLRTTLLRLDEHNHVLLLIVHHVICDGWSLEILFRELATLYEACVTDSAELLSELPIQYGDFAYWQRQWLQSEVVDSQLAYWKQQLCGDLPVLELPTDRPRPSIWTSRGATQSYVFSHSLDEALTALSRKAGVTLFMTLLAAFQTLLYRYTDQTDVCVGTPIANRAHPATQGLIGFFVNTLVLRTDLSGNPTFHELLMRVREMTLAAYAHQDLPFEQLVEALQPERPLDRNPVFQVMFDLHPALIDELELPELSWSPQILDNGTAKFDVTLDITQTVDGLIALIEYNTDLFNAVTIDRMMLHFMTLLECIAASPDQRLLVLPLFTDSEYQQIVERRRKNQGILVQHQTLENRQEDISSRRASLSAAKRALLEKRMQQM